MGRLAYILEAMERKPSTEEVIASRISESEVKTGHHVSGLVSRIEAMLTQVNQRIDALEGGYKAQLQTLSDGVGDSLKTAHTSFDEARQADIKELKQDIAKVTKSLSETLSNLDKPDRIDEVLKAVSALSNQDAIDAIKESELYTLMALKNLPKPKETPIKPILAQLKTIEDKLNKPGKWVFDVEHDIVGDITKVVANEQTK